MERPHGSWTYWTTWRLPDSRIGGLNRPARPCACSGVTCMPSWPGDDAAPRSPLATSWTSRTNPQDLGTLGRRDPRTCRSLRKNPQLHVGPSDLVDGRPERGGAQIAQRRFLLPDLPNALIRHDHRF